MRWLYGRSAFVRYVITKFSCSHTWPIYLSNGAPPRALRARELRWNGPIADRRVPNNDPRMNCGTHFVSSPLLVSEVANSMPNVRSILTELTISCEKKNNECILSISCTIYWKNMITTTIYCFIKHSFVFVLMRQQAIPLANENWTSININNYKRVQRKRQYHQISLPKEADPMLLWHVNLLKSDLAIWIFIVP